MRLIRLQTMAWAAAMTLPLAVGLVFLGLSAAPAAQAQSMLAGDIAGTVTDPSGAAVVGAKVTATSRDNGSVATTTTSGTGGYRFSLLKPGSYTIAVSAPGFKGSSATVSVAIGQIVTENIALALGATSETVEVSATSQQLQTDTAQLTTEVSLAQLQNIPNPGSDITYEAQAKPGIVMNTGADSSSGTLGYGNFSAFGLPGTSNNFTVNGMEVNDPFLNLNNSGPSNLLLGLNDIAETDVITNAYDVQYGTLAGVQLNSISRSGSNQFHGNIDWSWNGRSMNANDWFNTNPIYDGGSAVPKPFSNFNQWAAGVGGPILKNKLFFFGNTEGITFITSSQNIVYFPSTSFASSVVGTDGKCDNATSSLYSAGIPSATSECAFYNQVFSLYEGAPNYSKAGPAPNSSFNSPGVTDQLALSVPSSFALTEKLITGRVDMNLGPSDKAFAHYKYDHGLQPTHTDPINSAFDAQSDQPDDEGQFAETHTFGTRAVNQFLMTGSWYSAVFVNKNPAKELQTFPMDLTFIDGFASDLNNLGYAWPEGRNVTQWQLGDDFSYTRGKQTFKAGIAFKKDDLSDFDTGLFTTPVVGSDVAYGDFPTGQSILGQQDFPTNLDLPLSLYTLGMYFEDDFKPTANTTVTAGIRVERNSNVSCRNNCLSNFGGSFLNLVQSAPLNSATGAYNKQIKYDLPDAFTAYQRYMVEPRLGFTYSPNAKTVIRGGAGIFTDVFPGTIADDMLDNPPLNVSFLIYGATFGTGGPVMALQPSNSTSFQSLAAGANATFVNGFKSGGSSASMLSQNSNYSNPSFTTVAGQLHYPTYIEWNLQIQQAFTHTTSIQIGYVGNRGYHEPDQNEGVNATGGFGLPASVPYAPSFGPVNQVESNAASNYNGLIVSWIYQGHGLNTQVNYSWSHALDEISNGGILPFNSASIGVPVNPLNLHQNYGNADYDVPQSLSANYLYQIPYSRGPHVLTADWTIGGTLFFNSGNAFTPTAYLTDYGVSNYGNGYNVAAIPYSATAPHHCTNGAADANGGCFKLPTLPAVTTSAAAPTSLSSPDFPEVPWVNNNTYADCVAYDEWDPALGTGYCDADWKPTPMVSPFGAAARNQFWGPHYFDSDVTLLKGFHLPHMGEQGQFQAGLTAFNVFNHPDHGIPASLIDDGTSQFGYSTYMEGPPTSIYGSGVGGDPSVRIVEFNAKLVF